MTDYKCDCLQSIGHIYNPHCYRCWMMQLAAKDREIERLTGVLDIIQRENAGEADDWLAVEYGGTGYENHPACVSTRHVRAQLQAQVAARQRQMEMVHRIVEHGDLDFECCYRDQAEFLEDVKTNGLDNLWTLKQHVITLTSQLATVREALEAAMNPDGHLDGHITAMEESGTRFYRPAISLEVCKQAKHALGGEEKEDSK